MAEMAEVDLSPLLASRDGCAAADWRINRRQQAGYPPGLRYFD